MINEFQDIPRDIDDVEFAEAEANEPWIQNVLIHLHQLIENFKPRLSQTSFDQLISYLTNTVASTLERAVLKSKFTQLGGIQFDREARFKTKVILRIQGVVVIRPETWFAI